MATGCERSDTRWIFLCGKQPVAFVAGWRRRMSPKECQEHFKSHGHYPNGVRRYQVPGQPRVMARYWANVASNFESL